MPGTVSPGTPETDVIGPGDGSVSPVERQRLAGGRGIVLRLKAGYAWPVITDDEAELLGAADRLRGEPSAFDDDDERKALWSALAELSDAPVTRLVSSVRPSTYYDRENVAADTDLPPAASLSQYWRMNVRGLDPDRRVVALQRLRALAAVELAYVEALVSAPSFTADPLTGDGSKCFSGTPSGQCYVEGGGKGVNARGAWDLGITGAGVRIVDVERAWLTEHDDSAVVLPAALLSGDNVLNNDLFAPGEFKKPHGTAVLGVLAGLANGKGIVGIAHGAEVKVSSHFHAPTIPDTDPSYLAEYNDNLNEAHVADAIMAALQWLGPGDVLLLEVQRDLSKTLGVVTMGPTELDPADRDAIRVAVAQNVIVVEAAGNGDQNLDAVAGLDTSGTSGTFEDSGAILVGACRPGLPSTSTATAVAHGRLQIAVGNGSCYGDRVDCYAWGLGVVSTGVAVESTGTTTYVGGAERKHAYSDDFSGTSSAAAIIAGAAALVSAHYRATFGGQPLNPLTLRDLFRDATNGTASANPTVDQIGPMPDLVAVLAKLGLVADVYVRDNTTDTGAVPSSGIACISPDIIVRQSPYIGSLDAAIGEASGTANVDTLSQSVLAAQAHAIYVRVQNRGAADASNVKANVYYAAAATLLTPAHWTPIGTTNALPVPAGDTFVVLGPLSWTAPAAGHYCFIAVIGGDEDPAPTPPDQLSTTLVWRDFLALIQHNNNIAWRNFDVVSLGSARSLRVPFLLHGAPDRRRPFTLQISADLPWDTSLRFELSARLVALFGLAGTKATSRIPKAVRIPARGTVTLPTVWLGPRDDIEAAFEIIRGRSLLTVGAKARGGRPTVTIRQIYGGVEVGRLSFLVVP